MHYRRIQYHINKQSLAIRPVNDNYNLHNVQAFRTKAWSLETMQHQSVSFTDLNWPCAVMLGSAW